VYMQMSCVNGFVVALDWYLPHAFFRSDVSGVGVLMHALCLMGGVCGAGVFRCTRGSMLVMGRLV